MKVKIPEFKELDITNIMWRCSNFEIGSLVRRNL